MPVMNKIEKIIDSGFNSDGFVTFERENLKVVIKEYAEWYAYKCLKIAAENATGTPAYDYSNPYTVILLEDKVNINENSILNIKLPEHEQ